MDLQQETLARSLGDGYRVIHGVAGSGKNMILGYRAKYCRIVQICNIHDIRDFDASFMQHRDLLAPLLKLIKGLFCCVFFFHTLYV